LTIPWLGQIQIPGRADDIATPVSTCLRFKRGPTVDRNGCGAREVAPGAVVGSALAARHHVLDTYPLDPTAYSGDRIATRDTYEAGLRPEMQFMNHVV